MKKLKVLALAAFFLLTISAYAAEYPSTADRIDKVIIIKIAGLNEEELQKAALLNDHEFRNILELNRDKVKKVLYLEYEDLKKLAALEPEAMKDVTSLNLTEIRKELNSLEIENLTSQNRNISDDERKRLNERNKLLTEESARLRESLADKRRMPERQWSTTKSMLLDAASLAVNTAERSAIKVQLNEELTAADASLMLNDLNNEVSRLIELKAELISADTSEEVNAAGKKISVQWQRVKNTISINEAFSSEAQLNHMLSNAEQLNSKVGDILNDLQGAGIDVTTLRGMSEKYDANIASAREQVVSAHEQISDATKNINNSDSFIRNGKKSLASAHNELEEAHKVLKDIVRQATYLSGDRSLITGESTP